MTIDRFIESILQGSAVVLDTHMHSKPSSLQRHAAEELLELADENARLHAPGTAPELCMSAAIGGALVLRWVAAMCVDRLDDQVEFPEFVRAQLPSGDRPEDHWSMDFMLGVLPDLRRRVQKTMNDDPLSNTLDALAERWPLSCGVSESTDANSLRVVNGHPCLAAWLSERHGVTPKSVKALDHWLSA